MRRFSSRAGSLFPDLSLGVCAHTPPHTSAPPCAHHYRARSTTVCAPLPCAHHYRVRRTTVCVAPYRTAARVRSSQCASIPANTPHAFASTLRPNCMRPARFRRSCHKLCEDSAFSHLELLLKRGPDALLVDGDLEDDEDGRDEEDHDKEDEEVQDLKLMDQLRERGCLVSVSVFEEGQDTWDQFSRRHRTCVPGPRRDLHQSVPTQTSCANFSTCCGISETRKRVCS